MSLRLGQSDWMRVIVSADCCCRREEEKKDIAAKTPSSNTKQPPNGSTTRRTSPPSVWPLWLDGSTALPADLQIRPLSETDYQCDQLQLLAGLTSAPDHGLAEYKKRFQVLRAINQATPDRPSYCILCIVRKSDDKLVGSGTLLLEHNEKLGAYKTILDCNKYNTPFYEKCGFQHREYKMVRYTDQETLDCHKAKFE
ncbi:hypothetical protein PCASD_01467 [Puccinia coronata f. sp. avenae]|uniref:Glucosamine 6-phosphate N-acetyltransferase n=1 Tax=Puccinia coronata f. sp. avenae TaxID=200324 RepID=A0A2N5VKC9_9BASI|nr:hypothetical protein PCASD_01467 [Puccinia coronata f. sp. avenae]